MDVRGGPNRCVEFILFLVNRRREPRSEEARQGKTPEGIAMKTKDNEVTHKDDRSEEEADK